MVKNHGGKSWLLADAGLMQEAKSGQSLQEVAHAAGVDPDGLLRTVEAHNDAIDSGTTDPVGKLMNISVRSDPLYPTPILTLGGIRVDEDTGAVLNAAGAPIPGLFSAGRTAIGICSESYVSGLSISDCVFAGRRAGASAADQPSQ
jgi:3-oxo-5alpha-steroid 4-dehydrogenase